VAKKLNAFGAKRQEKVWRRNSYKTDKLSGKMLGVCTTFGIILKLLIANIWRWRDVNLYESLNCTTQRVAPPLGETVKMSKYTEMNYAKISLDNYSRMWIHYW